ncbi:hypothetical protein [Streptomyces sp. BpilaLS-43]|uniref:hypothetical protein n=1 Tax=unclassified Streptomyces TaxID=2593676 RepID=UPI00136BEAE8|nr:hypothetical protein [Streptomyces sp. BpilaLS-43]MYX71525.1 hypothetical protein [Streptomyces sp. SID3915]
MDRVDRPVGNSGRILAAYGELLVAGSITPGHGRRRLPPSRYDLNGTLVRLVGMAVIRDTPRGH